MFNKYFLDKFKIHDFTVGSNKTYIIAEAGSNHNGEIEKAIELIDAAKKSGSNAIKFQLFKAEYLVNKWSKDYKNLKKLEFKRDWLPKIINYCQKKKIHFLASPFDINACDLLIKLKVGAIKIASTETFNLKLINYISKKNIPLIISTGIANYIDILECLEIIKKNNNNKASLLQCSSIYPTKNTQVNLRVIDNYKKIFNFPIGFSDHTLGGIASEAAVAKGANLIEKHFTLDRGLSGPDHFFAVEPKELKQMIKNIRSIEKMQGLSDKYPLIEETSICRKKGLYLNKVLKKNTIIKKKDLLIKYPQKGVERRFLELVEGLRIKKNVPKGAHLSWKDLK